MPMVEKFAHYKKKLKFLEIGLGCNMGYGPGASVRMWKDIFKQKDVEIWEAELVKECVDESHKKGMLDGINVLVGDQSNPEVLQEWIVQTNATKAGFDLVIDDGGHRNDMMLLSLQAFFPVINPGGWYFIEDLEVSFMEPFIAHGFPPITVVLQSWIETLHVGVKVVSGHHRHLVERWPLPQGCDMILCQKTACALHKREY